MQNSQKVSMLAMAAGLAIGSAATGAGKQAEVKAAFLLLAQSGSGQTVPMARVILDGADTPCPTLLPADGEGAELPMAPRVNPDKNNFPVTVCEAIYAAGGPMKIEGSETVLPQLLPSADRVTVFGDTGCKPDDQHGCKEDSKKSLAPAAEWPTRRQPIPGPT